MTSLEIIGWIYVDWIWSRGESEVGEELMNDMFERELR